MWHVHDRIVCIMYTVLCQRWQNKDVQSIIYGSLWLMIFGHKWFTNDFHKHCSHWWIASRTTKTVFHDEPSYFFYLISCMLFHILRHWNCDVLFNNCFCMRNLAKCKNSSEYFPFLTRPAMNLAVNTKLDITFHVITSQLSGHCDIISDIISRM